MVRGGGGGGVEKLTLKQSQLPTKLKFQLPSLAIISAWMMGVGCKKFAIRKFVFQR